MDPGLDRPAGLRDAVLVEVLPDPEFREAGEPIEHPVAVPAEDIESLEVGRPGGAGDGEAQPIGSVNFPMKIKIQDKNAIIRGDLSPGFEVATPSKPASAKFVRSIPSLFKSIVGESISHHPDLTRVFGCVKFVGRQYRHQIYPLSSYALDP